MLILLLGIAIIALITFFVLRVRYASSRHCCERDCFTVCDFFSLMCLVSVTLCLGLISSICLLATKVATESMIIDSKIAMYQEENTYIEQEIDKIIKEYVEYEHDILSDLETEESSINLVTFFQNKLDTLERQRLDNNAEIKSLREEENYLAEVKWFIYFGR